MATKKTAPTTRARGCGCLVVLVLIVAVVVGIGAIVSSHTSTQSAARSYIKGLGSDPNLVQATVEDVLIQVGLAVKSPTEANLVQLATIASQAHTGLNNVRDDFAGIDSGALGTAELKLFDAANQLKNSMGALVGLTANANPATIASFNTQYQTGNTEWNSSVTTIWGLAHESNPPTIPTASQNSTQTSPSTQKPAATTTTSTTSSVGAEPAGALAAVNAYWRDIGAGSYAAAYDVLVPGAISLTQAQFVSTEQQAGIQSVQFSGQIDSGSGISATIDVSSLVTKSRQNGCQAWSGSYEMTNESGAWLIARANLVSQPCSG